MNLMRSYDAVVSDWMKLMRSHDAVVFDWIEVVFAFSVP